MSRRPSRLGFAVLILAGCDPLMPNERPPFDAGMATTADAGGMESGVDGSAMDSGVADGRATDGGIADGSATDGGIADGSATDGGIADGGPPSLDLYVDVNATLSGTGTPGAPLKSITAALAIAPHGATIHVAGGTYDSASGEQFPIILRGVSLVGSKTSTTTIHGAGYYHVRDNRQQGVIEDHQYPTLVMGDDQLATLVRGVTMSPDAAIPNGSLDGILCDRGPTPHGGASNTRVEGVTLDIAYDVGIFATGNHDVPSSPTGCSLTVIGSKIHGNIVGGLDDAASASLFAGGPGIGEGNLIDGQGMGPWSLHAGIFIFNHTARTVVEGNVFSGSEDGMNMGWGQRNIAIRSNTFQGLTRGGVMVNQNVVEELRNNRFIRNVAGAKAAEPAYGLALRGNINDQTIYAQIVSARGNSFLGNDVGIHFFDDGHGPSIRPSNFGDTTSLGANVFRCNGAAVRIDGTFSDAITFVGNGWDHNPPHVATGGAAPAGTDVFVSNAGWPGIATGQDYQASDPCP